MKKYLFIIGLFLFFADDATAATIWNKKKTFPGNGRHRSTGFSIGNIGYVGLGHYNSGPGGNTLLEDFWSYDPSTDSWTQVADFGGGLRYHCIDWVFEGKAYVGTGRDVTTSLNTDIWKYDPIANTWVYETDLPSYSRRGSVCFVIGEYGFLGCGQLQSAPTFFGKDFYAYHFPTSSWFSIPDLPGPERTSSVAFVIDNKGYVGTGSTSGGAALDFYEYKPSTNSWTVKADVGTIPRVEAWGFSLLGKGYIMCGASWSSGFNYSDMYEYDPATDSWIQLPDFPALGRRYLEGFEINNKAYVTLGTNGTNLKDLWEFDPANAVGIANNEEISVEVYPNPASDYLSISLDKSTQVEIYNSQSQLVEHVQLSAGVNEIDVMGFAEGIYVLIFDQNDQMITKKVVIKR